jgi:hypothetical protein
MGFRRDLAELSVGERRVTNGWMGLLETLMPLVAPAIMSASGSPS